MPTMTIHCQPTRGKFRAARPVALLALTTTCVVASPPLAWAQSTRDPAAAQALFEGGKQLFQDGHYKEACPKLAESQRLDPGGGTLLLLAMCHEAEGKTATAWAEFDEAASAARTDHRADRESAATEHLRALEARLTRVTIQIASPVEGLEVHRDSVLLGKAQWGTPLPVDPGVHVLHATAPGKKPWSARLPVPAEAKSFAVTIPALEDEAEKPPPPPVVAKKSEPRPAPRDGEEKDPGASQRTWALVAGGAGIVATGIGVAFGLSASSKWSDVEAACPNLRCPTAAGVKASDDAGRAADLSTGFIVAGGVVLAGAAVLFFTAPHANHEGDESARLHVAPLLGRTTAGIGLSGAL